MKGWKAGGFGTGLVYSMFAEVKNPVEATSVKLKISAAYSSKPTALFNSEKALSRGDVESS